MSVWGISYSVVLLGVIALFICCARARRLERSGRKMHSRPLYYGWWAFFLTVAPALLCLAIWSFFSSAYLEKRAFAAPPPAAAVKSAAPSAADIAGLDKIILRDLADNLPRLGDAELYRHASYQNVRQKLSAEHGVSLAANGADYMLPPAADWAAGKAKRNLIGAALAALAAALGFAYSYYDVRPLVRARNKVERIITCSLFLASLLAVAITAGIILSMLLQTVHFFESVSLGNFFFGAVWDPRFAAAAGGGQGQFGLLPLLFGTLYIALVAMLFAVPIGLFAAIYMSEYAGPRLRAFIKPLLEILAGIPTIVYGFFAVMTVGPFLRDISAALAGGQGFIQAQSVLTAGFVMGIMLIPFVSSLSDDIISAVPRALRDGSYGLGATQSETVKKVVLPAALPGIVAALLLTASRAIGETMIVVLAAGVAANITLNPFEPMTTITVKIVNQLTGDMEFNSPQTLVAFALGMTLFVLTLLMNVFALYIVRKYREQYE